MTCQCRIISCNKYTTLVQDIDRQGDYECGGGWECLWNFLHLPLSFAEILKLILKKV